jgi:hypothetical protein
MASSVSRVGIKMLVSLASSRAFLAEGGDTVSVVVTPSSTRARFVPPRDETMVATTASSSSSSLVVEMEDDASSASTGEEEEEDTSSASTGGGGGGGNARARGLRWRGLHAGTTTDRGAMSRVINLESTTSAIVSPAS